MAFVPAVFMPRPHAQTDIRFPVSAQHNASIDLHSCRVVAVSCVTSPNSQDERMNARFLDIRDYVVQRRPQAEASSP